MDARAGPRFGAPAELSRREPAGLAGAEGPKSSNPPAGSSTTTTTGEDGKENGSSSKRQRAAYYITG